MPLRQLATRVRRPPRRPLCSLPPAAAVAPELQTCDFVFGTSLRHSVSKHGVQHYGAHGRIPISFETIDANLDGKISRSEWNAFRQRTQRMPTKLQLRRHAVACAVPMVGFGAMDNFIMIQAGDIIDTTIGVSFGLATMTAAACGQICSDFSGVCFGGTVEALANRLGLPSAGLTPAQAGLPQVKLLSTASAAAGVVFGCIIGMCSLLFMDLEKAERLKRAQELDHIFEVVFTEGKELLSAEQVNLFLLDSSPQQDSSRLFVSTRNVVKDPPTHAQLSQIFERFALDGEVTRQQVAKILQQLNLPLSAARSKQWEAMLETFDANGDGELPRALLQSSEGCTGSLNSDEFHKFAMSMIWLRTVDFELDPNGFLFKVQSTGEMLFVQDAQQHPNYANSMLAKFDELCGHQTHALLYGPVKDDNGKVIGIIQLKNKKSPEGQVIDTSFSGHDAQMLQLLCSHVSLFLKSAGNS